MHFLTLKKGLGEKTGYLTAWCGQSWVMRWKYGDGKKESVECLAERYLRWILGTDSKTPGYLMREELQRVKLKEEAG